MELLEQYQSINSAIEDMNRDIQRSKELLQLGQDICSVRISASDTDSDEQLKNNAKNIARVNAFLKVAADSTTNRQEASAGMPYDHTRLSRIAVQIQSRNNDPAAAILYKEASAQLITLKKEREQLAANQKEKAARLREDFGNHSSPVEDVLKRDVSNLLKFMNGSEFTDFASLLDRDRSIFSRHDCNNTGSSKSNRISVGTIRLPLHFPKEFASRASVAVKNLVDFEGQNIRVPISIDISDGCVMVAEFQNASEKCLLSGIQNLIYNVILYHYSEFDQICVFDPVRFSAAGMGCLEKVCGINKIIDDIPFSKDELKKKLNSVVSKINANESGKTYLEKDHPKKLLVFHNFPDDYDSTSVDYIRQLCASAKHYGNIVILTHNLSLKRYGSDDAYAYAKGYSDLTIEDGTYYCDELDQDEIFEWYPAPKKLPDDFSGRFRKQQVSSQNVGNVYSERVGFTDEPQYHKGIRKLDNIPYGVDKSGNILTLDFENSNFATFICGAARSGKSTLLHTIITGIIQNTHPDDVEIWLADFKMTEFSRYISHLPPHVRYVILDESPELVYDIIDRLTDVLNKRQSIFKGKWQKLSDVPKEKYMPAIFVIIDEFSIMSQIISESVVTCNKNYVEKLQALLAKGAALGMYFIFSSQGFTSGTRGLSDFSKKQIQQRIAMKTEFSEIKDTLDLKSASEEDHIMMEQLPVHHTLVRIPVDERGNHLKLAKVLYIDDYSRQEKMIDHLRETLLPVTRFEPDNPASYISKKPLIIDGNSYKSFSQNADDIAAYLSNEIRDTGEVTAFIGEPRRMLPMYPIRIGPAFCENILIIAPLNEKESAASVLLSVAESLKLQRVRYEIWSTRRNSIYSTIKGDCRKLFIEHIGLESICKQIRHVRDLIENREDSNRFYILLGFESVLMDMSYLDSYSKPEKPRSKAKVADVMYERRAEGEMDILSQLNAGMRPAEKATETYAPSFDPTVNASAEPEIDMAYDAREDLKYILTNGPRLGYHFILQMSSAGDVSQFKINTGLFKHKIMFRASKADASVIMGSSGAGAVSELDDHSFRYSNGLESLSFRPYLHLGLNWDGWQIQNGLVVNVESETEDYLI